jgi:hypothetical protein
LKRRRFHHRDAEAQRVKWRREFKIRSHSGPNTDFELSLAPLFTRCPGASVVNLFFEAFEPALLNAVREILGSWLVQTSISSRSSAR